MTIETNRVRIISDKTTPPRTEMIGKEYKICRSEFLYDDDSDMSAVFVSDNNHRHHLFYKSDVRFLTPIKFGDRHIAIGDKVKWRDDWFEVISFAKTEKEEGVFVKQRNEFMFTLVNDELDEIQDHNPEIETDEYIEIDGEKWSKATIREALKNKLK